MARSWRRKERPREKEANIESGEETRSNSWLSLTPDLASTKQQNLERKRLSPDPKTETSTKDTIHVTFLLSWDRIQTLLLIIFAVADSLWCVQRVVLVLLSSRSVTSAWVSRWWFVGGVSHWERPGGRRRSASTRTCSRSPSPSGDLEKS